MTTAICIQNLSFSYDTPQNPVLSGMTVDLAAGTVTAVLGANGVGKTTLLYLLLGLYTPFQGDLLFFGKPGTHYKKSRIKKFIGMVSQNETIPFDLSVNAYVLLGRAPHMGLLSMPGQQDLKAAENALATVGMTHMADSGITCLSSGERQLVNVARALAQAPDILLLDEPCSHLDLVNSRQMLLLMKNIAEQGKTVVFTTHDPNAAAAIADKVMLLKKGELVAFGTAIDTLTSAFLTKTYGNRIEVIPTSHGPFVRAI
ncbi:MAG: ABC transporter ATP-binding protein [Proteobacteria bacterium]|nr:ABC transporter ATP-binding protein [Pseudomonadota bacterium]MBU1583097.1 ABC transporter ATP-binding protein [Pseudomonadota bacterium]MBU2453709.1 ABC transporter ATP-binding protein [Pseudomonadota bacterium]MBU2628838.1 ABC transporter ATP-binding protein [Pseudomonadota bacterium]